MELSLRYCSTTLSPSPLLRTQQRLFYAISHRDFSRREHSLRLRRPRLSCQCLQGGGNISTKDGLRVLRRVLNDAIDREDYCKAAILRDEILTLEAEDPVLAIKKQLEEAVKCENYTLAAQLRDQLSQMDSTEIQESLDVESELRPVSCHSDVLTRGIRIRVRSFYVEHLSAAPQGKYVFAYQVEILNEGHETVQLRHRNWKITDANGHLEETNGPGVIGQQPILGPGHYFQYMSVCPLETPSGTMEGCYEMIVLKRYSQETFYADIGRFGLDVDTHHQTPRD